jgi:hypothetical protein
VTVIDTDQPGAPVATFRVLGGDFAAKECFTDVGTIALFDPTKRDAFPDVRVPRTEIVRVEPATSGGLDPAVATAAGAGIGWAVGGDVGLVAGTVIAGRPRDVTFVVTLRDGRRFLAAGSVATYNEFRNDAARSRRP